jgi:outer membrane protein OmpA-like peptidoglycan-associated protein
MKNAHLQFEPSLATKKLQLSTRKAARLLGGRIHPGFVYTANAGRDVGLMLLAFVLEAASLALLWWNLPFHLGVVAGLTAIDTAGALLVHAGTGDANLRNVEIAAANTPEEEAAIAAQRPWYFKYLRAFGACCIVAPFLFKVGSIFTLPFALKILGAYSAALLVSFAGVAAIHLFITGYGLAYLRYKWAETGERNAMLRSALLPGKREPHENRIKATRVSRFATHAPLESVAHSDGHSLSFEKKLEDGRNSYLLETRGRFDDSDLDFMINGQHDVSAKAELCLHGLRHQIAIEQSEPLTSSGQPALTKPAPAVALPGHGRLSATATVLTVGLALGIMGCKEKPEPLKITIATTKAIAAPSGGTRLPEIVLALLAPPKPFAEKFVPHGEILRLDLVDSNVESLEPVDQGNAVQAGLGYVWQMESPELELAKSSAQLHERGAGIVAKPAPALDSSEAANRLVSFVTAARAEGREVVALSKTAKNGALTIAQNVSFDARTNAKDTIALIEEKLKNGAQPSIVVLLDPPAFADPAPESLQPQPESKELREKKDEPPVNQTSVQAKEEDKKIVQGSTFNVEVYPNEPGAVRMTLPPGSRAVGDAVLFDVNSAKVTDAAWKTITGIISQLRTQGITRVFLVAKADARGSEKSNLNLARHRGDAVQAVLIDSGIVVDSISVGESLARDSAGRDERQHERSVIVYTIEGAKLP